MKIMRWAIGCAALLLLFIAGIALINAGKQRYGVQQAHSIEMQSPYSNAELQRLIKNLSSGDAEERKRAEHELAQAGVFADNALDAAKSSAQGFAREAIQRLRDRSRFIALKNFDYSNAMPADSIASLHLANIQETIDRANKTAVGRLLLRPAFDAVRNEAWEKIRRNESGEIRQPPIEYLLKGQLALGAFQKSFGKMEKTGKWGLLFELKGADPQGEYLEWTDALLKSGSKVAEYKNIEGFDASPGGGSHARTGNTIFYGSDAEALHMLIDTSLSGEGIGAVEEVKRIRETQSKSPDLAALLDVPAIVNLSILSRDGEAKKPEDAAFQAVLEKIGYAGLSSKCLADGFEDRLTCLLLSGPGQIVSAFTAPPEKRAPLEMLQAVPSNAAAAIMGYIDGAKLEQAIVEFANSLKKPAGTEKTQPAVQADTVAPLRAIEQMLGLDKEGLAGLIKGEAGIWIELKPGGDITQPDFGAVLTGVDEKSAGTLSGIFEKLAAFKPAGGYVKSLYNKRALHSLNLVKSIETGQSLNWTVDRNRIYFASSAVMLKNFLDNLDRNLPGLLKRDALQKALSEFSALERRGTVVYIDTQTVLTQIAEKKIPDALTDPKTEPFVKKVLSELPPPVDLFRDFPPVVAFTVTGKDRGEWIVHSPVPLFPTAALLFFGAKVSPAK